MKEMEEVKQIVWNILERYENIKKRNVEYFERILEKKEVDFDKIEDIARLLTKYCPEGSVGYYTDEDVMERIEELYSC